MQLPRGTFREIRKGVAIESLLHALDGEKFSGVASISSPSLTGSLVFKAGKCILVKFGNSRGDTGWDEILKAGSDEVDAALSLLGDAQIELALEFNKPCRILKSGKRMPDQAPHRSAQPASREPSRAVQAQKPAPPVSLLKPPAKPAPVPHHVPAPPAAPKAPAPIPPQHPPRVSKTTAAPAPPLPPMPSPPHEDRKRDEEEELSERDRDTSSFEKDLDSFDAMDIDNVTDKIRTDCKTMIKQLHLDHLMDR